MKFIRQDVFLPKARFHQKQKTLSELNRESVLCYFLAVSCWRLSIYIRFSQSFTYIGLSAVVPGMRIPAVSALPLGSKR